ncbi:MAG: response regulator transcription factor [Peptococcaceae bacterium]|nr:response regulator transcription factor [Peptococcaceae bacterium]
MTILIIDDDPRITALLKRALAFEGYNPVVADTGAEGLKRALAESPDLVVLDIMMPGMDGWEVCRRIRAESDVPVLMLTARDDVADRVKGLDLGADDYLVKPFALEEFLARVRALLRRQKAAEGARTLAFADLTLNTGTREVFRGNREVRLTAREFDLLLLFMEHPRQVLTRDMLMEKVWGFDYSGESNVLEVYVGMLRQKLEEAGEKRLIHTVRGVGYVLKEMPSA